ncbi:nucleosome assembly protein [Cladorrhinum sp. PSN259]|nr:nucleosome assembly protein [Cladorrhinum sp. PSN259]
MAAVITAEEIMATYEDLAKLEAQFDDVETETIRYQYNISKELYVKRAEVIAKIPSFWPLVFEQAPMDIDEFIQPADSAVLLGAIANFSVQRFEIDTPVEGGDPRSVLFRFEFNENDHFEDKVLEKKFWWRHGKDGSIGYCSEPVEIKWKEGKDLTNGLLSAAKATFDENKAAPKKEGKEKKELGKAAEALKKKMEEHEGELSFFAWFGFVGDYVTAEENAEVVAKKKTGIEFPLEDAEMADGGDDEDDEDWEDEEDLEIFPNGDDVAMALADDLWPNALKYFTHAQEEESLSDLEFESGDEEEEEEEDSSAAKPKSKKHKKACAHGCEH